MIVKYSLTIMQHDVGPAPIKSSEVSHCIHSRNVIDIVKFNFQRPIDVPRIVVDSTPEISPDPSASKFSFDVPMLSVGPSNSDADMDGNMPGAYHAGRRPRRTSSARGLAVPSARQLAPPQIAGVSITRPRRPSSSSRAPSPGLFNSSLGRRTRSPPSGTALTVVKAKLVVQKDIQKEELFDKIQKQLGDQSTELIKRNEELQNKVHEVGLSNTDIMARDEELAVINGNLAAWKEVIEMKDRELRNIGGDLAKAEVMLKANGVDLARTNWALQERGDELTRLGDGLRHREKEWLDMSRDMECLKLEIAERDKKIVVLGAEATTRQNEADQRIKANEVDLMRMSQTLQAQRDEFARLNDGLRHRDDELLKMGQEMGGLMFEIAEKDEVIATWGAEVTTRQREGEKMAEEIESLKQADKERQEEKVDLEKKVCFTGIFDGVTLTKLFRWTS